MKQFFSILAFAALVLHDTQQASAYTHYPQAPFCTKADGSACKPGGR